jgi:hypothetical protein
MRVGHARRADLERLAIDDVPPGEALHEAGAGRRLGSGSWNERVVLQTMEMKMTKTGLIAKLPDTELLSYALEVWDQMRGQSTLDERQRQRFASYISQCFSIGINPYEAAHMQWGRGVFKSPMGEA